MKSQFRRSFFLPSFWVDPGRTYPRDTIVYYIPFTGDAVLLGCTPSNRIVWSQDVFIEDNCLCFEIISFSNNVAEIEHQYSQIERDILQQLSYVQREVEYYNNKELRNEISRVFAARKKKVLDKNNMLSALNVPLRKRDLPEKLTISYLATRKKITLEKPISREKQ